MMYIFLILAGLILVSCRDARNKGQEMASRAKSKVHEKKENLEDRIFAKFEHRNPDTRFNKQRFSEFFRFYPTEDVKDLYCYADRMGIDASYWFSFSCEDSTTKKIIKNLELTREVKPTSGLSGGLNTYPIRWWDSAFVHGSTPPWHREYKMIHDYLWYDSTRKKAYFLSFDL